MTAAAVPLLTDERVSERDLLWLYRNDLGNSRAPRNVNIYLRRRQGETFTALARSHGISVSRVRQIVADINWRLAHERRLGRLA